MQSTIVEPAIAAALSQKGDGALVEKWPLGMRVTKIKGSSWTGKIVGHYSTNLTPVGVAVESENEPGSVQIYPVTALRSISQGEGGAHG